MDVTFGCSKKFNRNLTLHKYYHLSTSSVLKLSPALTSGLGAGVGAGSAGASSAAGVAGASGATATCSEDETATLSPATATVLNAYQAIYL